MSRRVNACGEVKGEESRSRSESEPEEGVESHALDPKPGELPMARMKRG